MSRNDITGDEIKTRTITPQYLENHEKIFGEVRVQRGRWIQDPETGKLIKAEEYAHREAEKARFFLMDRWDAYESETSGKIIKNRKEREYDLKTTGCREYQGKQVELQEAERHKAYQRAEMKRDMRETMERTFYEIEHGYRRVE